MISFFIIVPTLNSYSVLSNLIDSLIQQTYSFWRVHFVDGESNRNHLDFLDSICKLDSRFSWKTQLNLDGGIFGAMNEGIAYADLVNDWLLFWGSDDRASSPSMLESVVRQLQSSTCAVAKPDLLVCNGTYFKVNRSFHASDNSLGRKAVFHFKHSYRRSLFFGSTPPHQATFFGPGALNLISEYSIDFKLASDLYYFLRLSEFSNVRVIVQNDNIVLIGEGGISSKQTKQRLREVKKAYQDVFKQWWWIPFAMRYLQRIQSKIGLL
jgi:glycosyltransferase involved in cell wall biosynthesis